MMKKLTISISKEVYDGLYAKIGAGNISRFIDDIARRHVLDDEIEKAYADMAADKDRERDAEKWTEGVSGETW